MTLYYGAVLLSSSIFSYTLFARGGAEAARKAHNLEVAGSNPAPATRFGKIFSINKSVSVKEEQKPLVGVA